MTLKPLRPLPLLLLLVGCSGAPPRMPAYYTLSAEAPTTEHPVALDELLVGPVEIPRMLDRPELLTRLAPHRIERLEDHQWAGPLEQQIQQTLVENLGRLLNTDRIALFPTPAQAPNSWRVSLQILELSGKPGEEARLHASWVLQRGPAADTRIVRSAHFRTSIPKPDPAALPPAYSRLFADLAAEIARTIRLERP